MTIDTSREAIEALMKGVTPGPWVPLLLDTDGRNWKSAAPIGYWGRAIATRGGPLRDVALMPHCSADEDADSRFIAASRQLVPALLDRAEKAEAELATLKAERERLRTAVRRANEMVPSISTPLMRGDNLAILLCSSFSEGGEEDDTGWDAAATAGYEEVIAAIRSHYAAALGDA